MLSQEVCIFLLIKFFLKVCKSFLHHLLPQVKFLWCLMQQVQLELLCLYLVWLVKVVFVLRKELRT